MPSDTTDKISMFCHFLPFTQGSKHEWHPLIVCTGWINGLSMVMVARKYNCCYKLVIHQTWTRRTPLVIDVAGLFCVRLYSLKLLYSQITSVYLQSSKDEIKISYEILHLMIVHDNMQTSLSKWLPGGHIRLFGFRTQTWVWFSVSTPNKFQ